MPNQCSNLNWNSCLCICEDVNLIKKGWSKIPFTASLQENTLKKCDDVGVCLENNFNVDGDRIKIKPPLKLNIDYSNNLIKEIK
jgi:hypothetical protein